MPGFRTPTRDAAPSGREIDAACESLEALKRHLTRTARTGGGEPHVGLLSAAAEDCPDAVLVCTPNAEIRLVNFAAARLTGYSTRELQSLTIWDLTHGSSQPDFDVLWREFLRAGRQRGTYTLRHRSGAPVEVAYCAEVRILGDFVVSVMRAAAA